MATIQQENSARNFLKVKIPEFGQLNPKDFTRDAELGSQFGFSEGLPYFERIIGLYKELASVDLSGVPFSSLDPLARVLTDAIKLFQKVREFDPKQVQNPNAEREALITSVRDQYDVHFQRVTPVLLYAMRKGGNFEELEKRAKTTLESVNKLAEGVVAKGQDFEKSANNTLAKLQEVAGKFGVAQHAVNFREQAEEHFKAAHRWFWATAGIVGLSVTAIWFFFIGPLKPELKDVEVGEILYSITSRLILFSIGSFAIYWGAKNHSSHRHNYIVNKHRQNALVTFQTFIEAAGDDQNVKNAVLLQAGQAVYSSQATGYSENVAAPVSPVSVVEVVKNATSK